MALDDDVVDDRYKAFFPTASTGRQTTTQYILQCSSGAHAECVETMLNELHADVLHARVLRHADGVVILSYRGEDTFPKEFLPAIAATVLKYDDGASAKLPLERAALTRP